MGEHKKDVAITLHENNFISPLSTTSLQWIGGVGASRWIMCVEVARFLRNFSAFVA
jgi:hypothetical protein